MESQEFYTCATENYHRELSYRNMLVFSLSKKKNTGTSLSLEINNLPLQIAFYCCYCRQTPQLIISHCLVRYTSHCQNS